MPDVSWTINTDPDGDVTATNMVGESLPRPIDGSELTVTFEFDTKTPYETLREYLDKANGATVTTFQDLAGATYYRETQSDSESLLLSFNPDGADMPATIQGWWGVLIGGGDATLPTATGYALELTTWVLAEYSDHADRAAAKTAHEK